MLARSFFVHVAMLAALCASIGCATRQPDYEVIDQHIVMADRKGHAVSPACPTERLASPCESYSALIDAAVDESARRVESDGSGDPTVCRILIHIHGGLKSPSASLCTAEDAITGIDKEAPEDWSYPIFMIWPSDWQSALGDHLWSVRRGRWAKVGGPLTMIFVLVNDIATGIVTAPVKLGYTWMTDAGLAADVAVTRDVFPSWKNAAEVAVAAAEAGYDVRGSQYKRGFWRQTGRFVSYWIMFIPKAVVQAIFLDGMGAGAWNAMLRRTRNVFWADEEFAHRPAVDLPQHLAHPGRGAFSHFLNCLAARAKNGDRLCDTCLDEHEGALKPKIERAAVRFELTIVAHSMGAIVGNEILRRYNAGDLGDVAIKNIVYMAPACSIRDAAGVLIPALERSDETRFYLLTLDRRAEADEAQWGVLDATPRGSLLEWIDGFYTNPPSHLDRVFGKWVNAIQAIHTFAPVKNQVVFKAFDALPGKGPKRHGEFNGEAFWRRSFWGADD